MQRRLTQFYGSKELDAAPQLIPQTGFPPPDGPRVVGTVDAVRRELDHGGLVRRYTPDAGSMDGLPGSEGTFLACSFWLADALHRTGREKDARELFERLLNLRHPSGCWPRSGIRWAAAQLDDFPQRSVASGWSTPP